MRRVGYSLPYWIAALIRQVSIAQSRPLSTARPTYE